MFHTDGGDAKVNPSFVLFTMFSFNPCGMRSMPLKVVITPNAFTMSVVFGKARDLRKIGKRALINLNSLTLP